MTLLPAFLAELKTTYVISSGDVTPIAWGMNELITAINENVQKCINTGSYTCVMTTCNYRKLVSTEALVDMCEAAGYTIGVTCEGGSRFILLKWKDPELDDLTHAYTISPTGVLCSS